jgi:DNA-binding NtrC family response regulator
VAPSPRLLVIDDDPASCRLVKAIVGPEGFAVTFAHDGEAGLDRIAVECPDVVVLDLQMPKMDGLQVLERLKVSHPQLPVLMLTGHQEIKTAVRATQIGAFDYLVKPVDADELLVAVRRANEVRALRAEVESLRNQVGAAGDLKEQMGTSPAVEEIVDQVRTVAPSGFAVLITGETGTGKELVAQALHQHSDRRARPFIAVDCGAIPEALIESELFGHERGAFTGAERRRAGHVSLAEGGTLFLDEVGNLPLNLQAKLLRVLESRQVQALGAARARPIDVRFVAATNDDLHERVLRGTFRTDLYFRLAQYTIKLPPLRDRPSDIPYLAQRFLREARVELRRPVQEFSPEALEALSSHAWPGNVRELRNVVRRAVLEAKGLVLTRPALQRFLNRKASTAPAPTTHAPKSSLKETADAAAREAERQAITAMLRQTKGNKSEAARALRTDYKTLHLKMKTLGIRAADFSP